jgi:hypothetical protein
MFVKKLLITGMLGAATLTGAGCANNTETGALAGGGTGAVLGAAAFRRAPLVGAVFGGAVGALTGAAIGNAVDRDQAAREGPPPGYYDYPPPAPYEAVPPPPYPGAVWRPGYWVRVHHGWLWEHGYWS